MKDSECLEMKKHSLVIFQLSSPQSHRLGTLRQSEDIDKISESDTKQSSERKVSNCANERGVPGRRLCDEGILLSDTESVDID